jgi:alkylation response protein AidB-like acyl-CoA dehydrogenase
LGWLGLEVPEALDGSGATFAETAVIVEECGRAASRVPHFGSAVLGVGALQLAEPSPVRDDLLRAIATGTTSVAVASGFAFEGGRVRGEASFVLDAADADRLLLLTADRVAVADANSLDVVAVRVLDATRSFATVRADGVVAEELSTIDNAALHDRAALAIAIDSLGIATAMLDATVAYAKAREQFGRPIGSFQAVKHACADMLVQVTAGRALVDDAVAALVAVDGTASAAVSMAKAYATAAGVAVAGKAMQLHGGIGYTWESGVHAYLKRAVLNRSLFGSPAAHRRRLAARYDHK